MCVLELRESDCLHVCVRCKQASYIAAASTSKHFERQRWLCDCWTPRLGQSEWSLVTCAHCTLVAAQSYRSTFSRPVLRCFRLQSGEKRLMARIIFVYFMTTQQLIKSMVTHTVVER